MTMPSPASATADSTYSRSRNIPGPNALIDVYTPDANTTGTLVVDGAHVLAASDTPGDNDWFKVTLTQGEIYQFGQYARAGGLPGLVHPARLAAA